MALVALGQLGGDEIRAGVAHDLMIEARFKLGAQCLGATDIARLEDGRADRHVGAR
ncbi:hypothetical protein D3C72_2428750 [compost metagenome]